MRDLTKSIASFSWAMSVFGAQQLANMMRPQAAGAGLDAVTKATENQLGDAFKSTYKMGDQMQRGMVDMAFQMMGPEGWDPSQWMKRGSEMMRQATEAMGSAVRSATGGASGPAAHPPGGGGAEGGEGWGPVPPQGA